MAFEKYDKEATEELTEKMRMDELEANTIDQDPATAELIKQEFKLRLGEIAADPDLQARVTEDIRKLNEHAQ